MILHNFHLFLQFHLYLYFYLFVFSNTDNSTIIYMKPKSKQNNNLNNGISTEERGIESKESPNNAANNGSYLKKPIK